MPLLFTFEKKIHLYERLRERERKREILPLIHFPISHHNQVWARQKPGVRNSILISHAVVETQELAPSTNTFPGALAQNWIRSRTDGIQKQVS